jgi:SAM-dependent methyltransferase
MPFNHNHHYHPLLLRQVPSGRRTALDVGCGLGLFARRLAERGMEVTGVDASAEMVAAARAVPSPVRFRQADVTLEPPEPESYDFISAIASLHHMPFGTVATLRDALRPGGVLAVLGLYAERPSEWPLDAVRIPVNVAGRLLGALRDRGAERPTLQPPIVWPPPMTLAQIRREAAVLLPGSRTRRLFYWRYLLVYRKPDPLSWPPGEI